jgi:hypothetical protein
MVRSLQVHIQFYSFTAKSEFCQKCQAEAAILSSLLAQYHSPSWTWFVACDEAAWNKVADHIEFSLEIVMVRRY